MSIKLEDFSKGKIVTDSKQVRKNWKQKIIDLLDKSDSLLTRSEIQEKLNMSSIQEVKQYCDKLVAEEKIIVKTFENQVAKYFYTTQKAIKKVIKKD